MKFDILTGISSKTLRRATEIQERIETLQSELRTLLGQAVTATAAPAKADISAHSHNVDQDKNQPTKPARKRKRNLSPEARAKLSATAKARWDKFRAAKRKSSSTPKVGNAVLRPSH